MTTPIDDRDHAALCQAYLDTTAHLRAAHALILHVRAGCECRTVADLAAALATLPPDLPVESLMKPSLAVQYLPGIQSHTPGGHYRAHLLIEGYDQDEGQLQHLPEVLP